MSWLSQGQLTVGSLQVMSPNHGGVVELMEIAHHVQVLVDVVMKRAIVDLNSEIVGTATKIFATSNFV